MLCGRPLCEWPKRSSTRTKTFLSIFQKKGILANGVIRVKCDPLLSRVRNNDAPGSGEHPAPRPAARNAATWNAAARNAAARCGAEPSSAYPGFNLAQLNPGSRATQPGRLCSAGLCSAGSATPAVPAAPANFLWRLPKHRRRPEPPSRFGDSPSSLTIRSVDPLT